MTTETIHICRCITRFDTLDWRSVTTKRCEGHAEQERLAEQALDPARAGAAETRQRVDVLLANLEASVQAAKEARDRKLAVDARDAAGAGAAEGDGHE